MSEFRFWLNILRTTRILHMHLYWQQLGWDQYFSLYILTNMKDIYAYGGKTP